MGDSWIDRLSDRMLMVQKQNARLDCENKQLRDEVARLKEERDTLAGQVRDLKFRLENRL